MCDQCDATYPVKKSLSNHKRLKHGDVKQFHCEHCVYSTFNKTHLEQHVRSLHEKIKEICESCGKEFSDKSHLNRHVRQFHSENKEETKRKATESIETPSKRIKTNEDNVNKTNKCTACDKEFSDLFNLNEFSSFWYSTI